MNSKIRLTAVLIFCLLRLNIITAQNKPDDAPIVKNYASLTWMPGLKAEYYFKENSCVFYSSDYNFNHDYRSRVVSSTRLYNRLGLEMNAGGKWYVGASLSHRLAYNDYGDNPNSGSLKANITHRGKIGSIKFIKELSGEYIHHFNNPAFEKTPDMQAGIAAALYKSVDVFKRPLGFLLSYKVLLNSNLSFYGSDGIYKDRRIDFTRIRMDVFYGITKNIYLGLFVLRETEYYYPPGSSAGSPPVNIYYKVNQVNPIVGLTVNLVLKPENCKEYIPGLPLR